MNANAKVVEGTSPMMRGLKDRLGVVVEVQLDG